MEHSNTKNITFDNMNYRMNKETNKGKLKWKTVIQKIKLLTT